MWFDELHLDAFVFKVSFYCFFCNIINDVENEFEIPFFKYSMFVLKAATVVSFFNFFTGVARMALEYQSYSMKMAVLPSMEWMEKLPV